MLSLSQNHNPNYVAKIHAIDNLHPHPNADRLQLTTIEGNTVVLGLDTKIGDLGIYFPLECRISEKYLSSNNQFEPKELNADNTKRGFFNKHGRVRACQLRGMKSEGYWAPVDTFNNAFGKIPEAVNGTLFDTVYGELFVQKYIPANQSKSNTSQPKGKQPKKDSKIIDGQFRFHNDTAQLGRNVHNVSGLDYVVVTQKLHGCLPGFQAITMFDGTKKRIDKIVVGDVVLGYDHETQKPVPAKVLNTFTTGKTSEWVRVKKHSAIKTTGKASECLYLTKDHKIFTVDKGYVDGSIYTVGDDVLVVDNEHYMSQECKEILVGMALGDAYVDRHNNRWAVRYGHKADHIDYLIYINTLLGDYCTKHIRHRVSGYGTKMFDSSVKASRHINVLFDSWFTTGTKQVPETIVLTPLVLAFWYMDDGSLAHHNNQEDRATFAICGFDDTSVRHLEKALIDYGFSNFTFYVADGYNRLRLNKDDAEILFADIAPLTPPVMQYKLPEKHRGKFVQRAPLTTHSEPCINSGSIVSVETRTAKEVRSYATKWDIETETHNFFASGILVHNSSAVCSNLLCKRKLSWKDKLAKKLGVQVQETQYDSLYSSRRVLKNGYVKDNNHYYGTDIWGTVNDEVLPFIRKGITLYGEIVGFINENKPIFAGYSYGCKPGEHAFYVYRITSTDIDGHVTEFTWDQVKDYCAQFGLNHVPQLYEGKFRELVAEYCLNQTSMTSGWTWDSLDDNGIIEALREKFHNKILDTGVPDEGICVRIERGLTQETYKLKDFAFLSKESADLDAEVVSIEDEN